MSVECLFSITPSYRRAEEQEDENIQRQSSARSQHPRSYRRAEHTEKGEEIQRRSSAWSQ